MYFRFLLVLAWAGFAAWACTPAPRPAAESAPALRATATYTWPGTYDLVGTGFPEGTRSAVMSITQRDTSYVLSLQGPPGNLVSLRIVGDSAHVAWDLGSDLMYVDLRGVGDAVEGRWRIGDQEGPVQGTRRR